MARHRFERPQPIPVAYRPMASVIVGERRPVHIATGTASRRALAKVGRRAATTGATIHLSSPQPTPEVMAHELTHVAHPSSRARFFGDSDRNPEERRAEMVAAVMRRAPILPRTSAAHGGVTGPATTIRRNPTTTTAPPVAANGGGSAASLWSSLTTSASELFERLTGGGTGPMVAPAVAAAPRVTPTVAPAMAPAPPDNPIPPSAVPPSASSQAATTGPGTVAAAEAATTDIDGERFERLLELLEDRIIADLERRGGRFRGGF